MFLIHKNKLLNYHIIQSEVEMVDLVLLILLYLKHEDEDDLELLIELISCHNNGVVVRNLLLISIFVLSINNLLLPP